MTCRFIGLYIKAIRLFALDFLERGGNFKML